MNMLIGYFGDGPWAHETLSRLGADPTLQIAFVCARNDAPDQILKKMAGVLDVDFISHPNVNSPEFIDMMRAYGCDIFVSMSFNQIFRHEIINLPQHKTINCHAGKLPFYRGRNILNWALINDEEEFGITIHYVDEGIDTGDIIFQNCYKITDQDDYSTLLKRAHTGCADDLYSAIKLLQKGKGVRQVQTSIHPVGFYCTARKVGDERLDWNQTSREVFNFVRAICRPGPEARSHLNDAEYKINKITYDSKSPIYKGIPGAVVGVQGNSFFIKTSDSSIEVIDWDGPTKPRIGDRFS